jgi:hypothetical protein
LRPVDERPGRHGNVDLVVEDDKAKAVVGAQPREQACDRFECGEELSATHGAAAVEDDLQGRGLALALPRESSIGAY